MRSTWLRPLLGLLASDALGGLLASPARVAGQDAANATADRDHDDGFDKGLLGLIGLAGLLGPRRRDVHDAHRGTSNRV